LSAAKTGPAEYVTLSNDFITVQFTNQGGAIHQVGLKKYPETKGQDPLYTLNAPPAAPALSLTDFPGVIWRGDRRRFFIRRRWQAGGLDGGFCGGITGRGHRRSQAGAEVEAHHCGDEEQHTDHCILFIHGRNEA